MKNKKWNIKIEVIISDNLWQEDEPGVISVWFYEDGATVEKDDILAEIMVQKSNFEMFSPAAGTLRILVNEEQEVAKGTRIAEIV